MHISTHYVVPALHIVTHPTNTSAAAPFSALFKCSIQAYGYLIVTWYRNNAYPIPKKAYSKLIPSVNVTTSILTIPNVTSEDVDKYYCVARVGRRIEESLRAKLLLASKYTYICYVLFVKIIQNIYLCRFTITTSNNDCFFSKPYC